MKIKETKRSKQFRKQKACFLDCMMCRLWTGLKAQCVIFNGTYWKDSLLQTESNPVF